MIAMVLNNKTFFSILTIFLYNFTTFLARWIVTTPMCIMCLQPHIRNLKQKIEKL